MWIFRELARLIVRVAVASAIAALIAGLLALVSTGDLVHDMRIMFLLAGALLILLAGAGNRASATARRTNWGIFSGVRGYSRLSPVLNPRPGQPTLTASAVFVASGAVLLVLGFVV